MTKINTGANVGGCCPLACLPAVVATTLAEVACMSMVSREGVAGEEGNVGLYVHRNHKGLLGTGKFGGSGIFISNTYSLHCHHQNDYALRWAAV